MTGSESTSSAGHFGVVGEGELATTVGVYIGGGTKLSGVKGRPGV
jgi:hypothetical protein